MTQTNNNNKTTGLKAERDRFVAFSFCWGDLLFELDKDLNISFASGAVKPVLGLSSEQLIGKNFRDIISDIDQPLLNQTIKFTDNYNRIESVSIRLQGPSGPTVPIDMMGYKLAELNDKFFIAFRIGKNFGREKDLTFDSQSGLLDANSFNEVAKARIKQSKLAKENVKMTMLDIPEIGQMTDVIGAESSDHVISSVGTALKASSVGGDTATRVSDTKFSIVHNENMDLVGLQNDLKEMAHSASDGKVQLEVNAASMELDAENISDEDLANGLAFTINQFKNERGSDFTMGNLTRNMSELVGEAYDKISTFKQVVKDHDFFIAFQPIIGTRDGIVHHYECLARFRGDQAGKSPYEYIVFAEETGLIPEFDLAMAKACISWLGQQPKGKKYHVAVNVSGRSIADKTYINGLLKVLKNNAWCRGSLMFEITESSRLADLDEANRFIQNLRKMGFQVCLDDFGAGAASFQYLSTLEVDIVKLDGSAVHNAMKAPKGKAFLKALGNLCRDLKVDTIAEMIDDPEGLLFVRECGIKYVQGYLFGKPSPNIENFDPFPNAELFSKRAMRQTVNQSAKILSRM